MYMRRFFNKKEGENFMKLKFGENENIVASFGGKKGEVKDRLVLTNFRVALEFSGSWFKKHRGMKSLTLASVHAAHLVLSHKPYFLLVCFSGLIPAFFYFLDSVPEISFLNQFISSENLFLLIGLLLFFVGLIKYLRSRVAGIVIMGNSTESLKLEDVPASEDACNFVSFVLEERQKFVSKNIDK